LQVQVAPTVAHRTPYPAEARARNCGPLMFAGMAPHFRFQSVKRRTIAPHLNLFATVEWGDPKERREAMPYGAASPHFSPAFYCGAGSGHVYGVALCRAPRRTVEYACGTLSRALLAKRRIPARLRHLATKPGEKSRLGVNEKPTPNSVAARSATSWWAV